MMAGRNVERSGGAVVPEGPNDRSQPRKLSAGNVHNRALPVRHGLIGDAPKGRKNLAQGFNPGLRFNEMCPESGTRFWRAGSY